MLCWVGMIASWCATVKGCRQHSQTVTVVASRWCVKLRQNIKRKQNPMKPLLTAYIELTASKVGAGCKQPQCSATDYAVDCYDYSTMIGRQVLHT